MVHCSRRLYHTLASSKFSTGFPILHVCTEHIDLRVTSVLRQSITAPPHGIFQTSFRCIPYDTFTNQTRQRWECCACVLHDLLNVT